MLKVEYARTGKSANINEMGMREMQARAFESRNSQYLLLKAPPASGKSRALMFLGLDKLVNQGLRKVVVAVPEMSIGASFRDTALTEHGFFTDWSVLPSNNLCLPGGEGSKVESFRRFMRAPDEQVLVCTHATLRFAFEKLALADFNDTLVAIDEFHHVSVDGDNRLGALIDSLMKHSSAHIVAMTGSYFRGDTVPILLPEDEAQFDKVTYTYYEQLNGYRYLKSLGIGYHFYQGRFIDALKDVLDSHKKTIIHIPNVNSGESTKDKHGEVDHILDVMGTVQHQDPTTGIITVKRSDGSQMKVANLVDDGPIRSSVVEYLRNIKKADDLDAVIALGMAKEGFDWPWCEHVLTIGYRSSMTEIVQIIGRATRDSEDKTHAQFTNLIAQPDAEDEDVKVSVNNMLKAITLSLLMEQVLAPTVTFKPRSQMKEGERVEPGTIIINDVTAPVSDKVIKILNGDSDDIIATLIQKPEVGKSLVGGGVEPEVINENELPKIIETKYPDLTPEEVEQVREGVLTKVLVGTSGGLFDEADLPPDAVIIECGRTADSAGSPIEESRGEYGTQPIPQPSNSPEGNRQFVKMGDKFINIENLTIDLIDQVNPFRGAYEILSKSVTPAMLKTIQDVVAAGRINMTDEEAVILWPRIVAFRQDKGREPSLVSTDPIEVRYAEGLEYLKKRKREKLQQQQTA
ncbi:Superfamily II DNA or RNA helicase [Pseudomonas syringae pv. actinidiae]|uniref:Superfamily II DNA or RNA helicase n=1 Tax=Pseudomonas syringae pv. actinidiae TaxID=103796 RepID=A0AAN4Q1Y0_PSESF|nr:Superfamily II DNA or RNA helicase [Pseudomonas syringae pv. actinidiae]